MAHQYDLVAEPRTDVGKGASRRLRKSGRVPGILYGGGDAPQAVTFDANALLRCMSEEAFFSSIVNVGVSGQTSPAIVRDYQTHPAKRAVLHLDLQRIVATEKLRIAVPLHFLNEAASKGVKESGGSVSHLLTEVEVSCLPKDLPEYIEVDIGGLELNQMLHLSDLALPAGVEIPGLVAGTASDQPVVTIQVRRMEEAVAEEGEAAAAVEGAPAAAAAAPAAGAEPAADKEKK